MLLSSNVLLDSVSVVVRPTIVSVLAGCVSKLPLLVVIVAITGAIRVL